MLWMSGIGTDTAPGQISGAVDEIWPNRRKYGHVQIARAREKGGKCYRETFPQNDRDFYSTFSRKSPLFSSCSRELRQLMS